jgi:hypothetical protein
VTADKATKNAKELAYNESRPYAVFVRIHDNVHYIKPLDQVAENEPGLAMRVVIPREGGCSHIDV